MTTHRRFARRTTIPRAIDPADRKRINAEFALQCKAGDFAALRLRAIVLLAAGAGLRLKEIVLLDTVQLLDTPDAPRWTIRSIAYVRPEQSKGARTGEHTWTSAGSILVSDEARAALRAYLTEARKRGWMSWPPKPGDPLFVGSRLNGRTGKSTTGAVKPRIGRRAIQSAWSKLQRKAGVPTPYRFHDLRHTAMTAASEATDGNVKKLAEFGRCDVVTAMRYIHLQPGEMQALRNRVAFGR